MNYLMRFSGIRFLFVLLSFVNFYLAWRLIRLQSVIALLTQPVATVDRLYIIIAIFTLSILAIYYLVKVIWRDKRLNLDSKSGTDKFFITVVMFATGFTAMHFLQPLPYVDFNLGKSVAVLRGVTGLYMLIVAVVSATFVSGFSYKK